MIEDYTADLADALALVTFGRGAWVEEVDGKFVVVRYSKEYNEAVRLAGAYTRRVLGEGKTRREAIEDSRHRHPQPSAPSSGRALCA